MATDDASDGSESLNSQDTDDDPSFDEADEEVLASEHRADVRRGKRKRDDSPDPEEEQLDEDDDGGAEELVDDDDAEAEQEGSDSQPSSAEPEHAPKRFRLGRDAASDGALSDNEEDQGEGNELSDPEPELDPSDEEDEDGGLDPDRFTEPSAGPAYLGPAAAKPLSTTYLEAAAEEPVDDELASD